ncbi:MAG: hypothetical protein RB191_24200 [Terriglobia bacterium]|nr:hypothetical protein [Terriglobia bacterium]
MLRPGKIFYSLAFKIDAHDSLTVIVLQVPDYVPNTGADRLLQFGLICCRILDCKVGIRSVSRSGPPVVIHNSVPEDAIEPGDGALLFPYFPTMFECLDVCGLEDILGSRPVTQTA